MPERALRGAFVIEYLQKGGLLMWPILICSIISIAVFAERIFYLHRATIHVGEFLKGLANLIKRRNFAEALHESAGTPGPVARVIHAAIIRHDLPRSELREIVQEAGQLEVPKLERFLGVLATLAYLAPLLGLLGTVAGMIEAFGVIASNGGYATVTELSAGIYKSLLTTAAGLVVATPTFVAFCLKLERLTSVWLVKRLARRFGQEVSPHHRKSSTRFDARQHRSEIRSCRSRFGLWQNEFLR